MQADAAAGLPCCKGQPLDRPPWKQWTSLYDSMKARDLCAQFKPIAFVVNNVSLRPAHPLVLGCWRWRVCQRQCSAADVAVLAKAGPQRRSHSSRMGELRGRAGAELSVRCHQTKRSISAAAAACCKLTPVAGVVASSSACSSVVPPSMQARSRTILVQPVWDPDVAP